MNEFVNSGFINNDVIIIAYNYVSKVNNNNQLTNVKIIKDKSVFKLKIAL